MLVTGSAALHLMPHDGSCTRCTEHTPTCVQRHDDDRPAGTAMASAVHGCASFPVWVRQHVTANVEHSIAGTEQPHARTFNLT
jgi:hypothetical protein